jgi:antitoxin component YwqK of YwqJK toxin-antitoxin module
MEAATMARRALLQTINLLALLWLTAFCSAPISGPSLNLNEVNVSRKNGITTVEGREFTGMLFRLNEKRDTLELTNYLNGKPHGTAKTWHTNGQLERIVNYSNGKINGLVNTWWEDGKQKGEYHYQSDAYHGKVSEWYPNGQLARKLNFKNGYESGIQKMWNTNGELWANYDARNGRQYGITGKKGCATIWNGHDVDVAKK